jgi:hypothetical protein
MIQLRTIARSLLLVGAVVLAAKPAFAQHEVRPHLGGVQSVPEIDPVAGGAVVSVLVAGTMLIGAGRIRRRERQ